MEFDIIFTDSDGGDANAGRRDSEMAWDLDNPNDSIDISEDWAFMNTRVFGIVNLMSDVSLPAYRGINNPVKAYQAVISDALMMYPNPAGEEINFVNLEKVKSIEIMNMLGQTIRRITVNDKALHVNISDLSSEGFLLVHYIYNDGTGSVQKLIRK